MRKLKLLLLVAIIAATALLVTGCGAVVSTTMNISTAENGFSGTRAITLTIENDDLSNVDGGITGLENVLKANIPGDITYTITYPNDSQSVITFMLSFSSLDEYRTKVTNLLAAGNVTDPVPEILYTKEDSLFKSGLQFKENFQSFDLIKWYYNALSAAKIISSDSSDWYEMGSSELIIDGKTVSDDPYFSAKEFISNCLDQCEVHTRLNPDGSFDRTITFTAYEDTLTALKSKTADFTGYMQALATEGIEFATEEHADEGYTTFTYTIANASADNIALKTNAVMQTEGNTFSVEILPKEGVSGTAEVTISESLDGSYYLDYDNRPIRSYIEAYPNFELTEGGASRGEKENEFSYSPGAGSTNTFKGDWLVGFEKVTLDLDTRSEKDMSVKLTFTSSETLNAELRNLAFSALEKACTETGSYSREGNAATLSASGSPDAVAETLNAFIAAYSGQEGQYCSISLSEMGTPSKFTNGLYGTLKLDLSPVLGEMKVYVTHGKTTKLSSDLEYDESGNAISAPDLNLSFTFTKLNILTLVLVIVFGVLLIAGIVVCIILRKAFKTLFKFKKKEQPLMPIHQEVPAPVAPAPLAEEVPAAPAAEEPALPAAEVPAAPTEEAQVAAEEAPADQEEEEEIL